MTNLLDNCRKNQILSSFKIKEVEKAGGYTEGIYSDTPANRKLGRVGMSYKQYVDKLAGKTPEKNQNSEDNNNSQKDNQNKNTNKLTVNEDLEYDIYSNPNKAKEIVKEESNNISQRLDTYCESKGLPKMNEGDLMLNISMPWDMSDEVDRADVLDQGYQNDYLSKLYDAGNEDAVNAIGDILASGQTHLQNKLKQIPLNKQWVKSNVSKDFKKELKNKESDNNNKGIKSVDNFIDSFKVVKNYGNIEESDKEKVNAIKDKVKKFLLAKDSKERTQILNSGDIFSLNNGNLYVKGPNGEDWNFPEAYCALKRKLDPDFPKSISFDNFKKTGNETWELQKDDLTFTIQATKDNSLDLDVSYKGKSINQEKENFSQSKDKSYALKKIIDSLNSNLDGDYALGSGNYWGYSRQKDKADGKGENKYLDSNSKNKGKNENKFKVSGDLLNHYDIYSNSKQAKSIVKEEASKISQAVNDYCKKNGYPEMKKENLMLDIPMPWDMKEKVETADVLDQGYHNEYIASLHNAGDNKAVTGVAKILAKGQQRLQDRLKQIPLSSKWAKDNDLSEDFKKGLNFDNNNQKNTNESNPFHK